MSFANLTPINLGMTGTFADHTYRVAGRVVMGMKEAGEIYYWNEFNLLGADGPSATLVQEVTEYGVRWRIFTLFDPQNPISAPEAAAKSVGDTINLDGHALNITLVDESRVYFIEGQAPEGVEVGDVARYFNAELRDVMIVVSWTGDEVEFYRGLDLPRSAVAAGFGLGVEKMGPSLPLSSATSKPASQSWVPKLVIAVFALVFFINWGPSCRSSFQRAAPVKPKLAASPLAVGAEGRFGDTVWRIAGHAVVEVASVGRLFDRHEYHLADAAGNKALLVHGSVLDASDWILFTPFQPVTPLTAPQAAALRLGDRLDVDGTIARVSSHVLATIRLVDGEVPPEVTNGAMFYGFRAEAGTRPILARWNKTSLTFYQGTTWPVKDLTNAFSGPRAK